MTDFVIGPAVSKSFETGMIPSCDTSPMVGRIVKRAALVEGVIKEPQESVPIAKGLYPALTATADPVEDPAGL